MKLYVTYYADEAGDRQQFHGSKSEMKVARAILRDDPKITMKPQLNNAEGVEVPTDKAGLLKFLNSHCSTT